MLNLQNDRYFAAGIVGALAALYAVSAFTYFSNSDIIITKNGKTSIESTHAALAAPVNTPDSPQLRNIMDKVHAGGVFSPLGGVESELPGVDCKLTETNLGFSYNFKAVPSDCFSVVGD